MLVCPKKVMTSPIAAYENTVEVQSLDQLEDIISDPDEMRMQALLVRERILGPAHPDTSYYIRYLANKFFGRKPNCLVFKRQTFLWLPNGSYFKCDMNGRFSIRSRDSLSLVILNNKTLEHWLLKVMFIAIAFNYSCFLLS